MCVPQSMSKDCYIELSDFNYGEEEKKQAGAELGQAQVKLDDIVEVVVKKKNDLFRKKK